MKGIVRESFSRVMEPTNGIGIWEVTDGNYTHKYEVSGNKIILYASNGDIGDTYRVVSIKGDVVVLEVTLDEGPQYKQQITCKRIY